jgi:protein gp37
MAEQSKIDYLAARDETEEPGGTWSPWLGCSHAGAGCAHCWAEEWASRFSRFRGHWGKHAPRYFFGDEHWQQPLRWQRKCERLGVRKRVLVSLCDPFERVACDARGATMDMARSRLWKLITQTPRLDWLVLTKRPENLRTMLPLGFLRQPQHNLWLGVSASDQSSDRNIPPLLKVPAAVHWVSLEPLLGPVDVSRWLHDSTCNDMREEVGCICTEPREVSIDWLVVGCESRGARPGRHCDLAWAHALREQCRDADVPMFTKQLAGARPGQLLKSPQLEQLGWPVELPR